MTAYRGIPERTKKGGFVVEVVEADGRVRPLRPRNALYNHSPDGFAWGYGGSGPAQLALALAADVLDDDERALKVYQDLKFAYVAGWAQDQPWQVEATELLGWIRGLEAKRAPASWVP